MKSLMLLFQTLLEELGSVQSTRTLRDFNTVTKRVEQEGFSFLTITLPSFHADFLQALDRGSFGPDLCLGFRRDKGSWLPAFLQGFTARVFNKDTGLVLDEPDPDAIYAVRQITLFFGKIEPPAGMQWDADFPGREARERRAYREFIETEMDVAKWADDLRERVNLLDHFHDWFVALFGDLCNDWDERIYNLSREPELIPGHGPGATADRLRGNRKWEQREWPARLDQILPAGEMLLPNWRYSYLLDSINIVDPEDERPVRVIAVPKTPKTPRIIAIEPTAMQYAQQMLASMLVDGMESARFPFSSMIGFRDQGPNQALACEGSLTGFLATLDLSEASDRVSNLVVRQAFHRWPSLSEAIQASRSLHADVPGYGVVPLSKFASMGSALTFPVEAMIFLTLIMMGIESERTNRYGLSHISKRNLAFEMRGQVRVYGDDMIVPVDCAKTVIHSLEAFGLKVNSRKSFWTGQFRESCGKEYFDGHDVSIVRCRAVLPLSLSDVAECISAVSLRNQLYESGLWRTAGHLDTLIERVFRGHYPPVVPSSAVLGRWSFLGYQAEKTHAHLHSPLVKGWVVNAPLPRNSLGEEAALLKWLLKRGEEPFEQKHLERSGRPEAVILKLRLASPF